MDVTTINNIRSQFPVLSRKVHDKPLVYFDNAASSQKPLCVIDAVNDYYKNQHANIHRALHYLGDAATESYEQVRSKVAEFLNAQSPTEIIFTKGTTDSINLIATSLERSDLLNKGDEIILTVAEHHSNIVPWQILSQKLDLNIKVVNILPDGDLDLEQLYSLLSAKTKILAINHVSNSLGTVNPIRSIISKIKNHNKNILVLIDGAQAIPNMRVDVTDLNCDFYAFSGHKAYGPTGVGVLYGKAELLKKLPPYQGGGEMIDQVKLPFGTTYADIPQKFEAGTPHIAGVIGLGSAIDFLNSLDLDNINQYKNNLTEYCTKKLKEIKNIKIYGEAKNKVSVVSFIAENINSQDVGLLLDQCGVAVRTGHHCTMPLMDYLGIQGTIRVSFGVYNTLDEIDIFIESLHKVLNILN